MANGTEETDVHGNPYQRASSRSWKKKSFSGKEKKTGLNLIFKKVLTNFSDTFLQQVSLLQDSTLLHLLGVSPERFRVEYVSAA